MYWIKYLSTHGETTIFHGLDITTFVVCYNTSVPNNVVVNTDLANRVHHELYLSHIRVNRMSSMNLIVPLMFLWLFFRADGRDLKNNYNEYIFGFSEFIIFGLRTCLVNSNGGIMYSILLQPTINEISQMIKLLSLFAESATKFLKWVQHSRRN